MTISINNYGATGGLRIKLAAIMSNWWVKNKTGSNHDNKPLIPAGEGVMNKTIN